MIMDNRHYLGRLVLRYRYPAISNSVMLEFNIYCNLRSPF